MEASSILAEMRAAMIGLAFVVSACSGSAPSSPTPTPVPTPTPAPTSITLTGHVTATNGGAALPGVQIAVSSFNGQTDATGTFVANWPQGGTTGTYILTASGAAILPRVTLVSVVGSRDVAVTAFVLGPTFDPAYFRAVAHDAYDLPTSLQPIRHLTVAPQVYLRTVDDAGVPIDPTTLNVVENTLLNTGAAWSGGQFGVRAVVRGTETRAGQAGWITVAWPNPVLPNECGDSLVGTDGETIHLNYLDQQCHCGGSLIQPSTVRHELGHAFGMYHSGDPADLMSGLGTPLCDFLPTAREQLYATYIYARLNSNVDPDTDRTLASLAPSRIVR